MYTSDWHHRPGSPTYYRVTPVGRTEVTRYGRRWIVLHLPRDPGAPTVSRWFDRFRDAEPFALSL